MRPASFAESETANWHRSTGPGLAADSVVNRATSRPAAATVAVAAFVLGIVGTVLAALSLGWQVLSIALLGARPKLTPIVGVLTAGGIVTNDATRNSAPHYVRRPNN